MGYAIGVDVGGTFTDVVLRAGHAAHDGRQVFEHPRRSHRRDPSGVTRVLGDVDPAQVSRVVHATTLATNAVLERKGARVAFVTTRGFRSVIPLGRYARVEEDRYDLRFDPPPPPVAAADCFEVAERVSARGTVLTPLDQDAVRRVAARITARGITSAAVCLLHSYAYPAHERQVAAILRESIPDVVISSEIWPEMREYERATTTIMSAYVGPVMARYLAAPGAPLRRARRRRAPVQVMESSGGVMSAELGGPPGGADHRVRPGGRGPRGRPAAGRRRRDLLRHGRHHGQGLRGPRRPPGDHPRVPRGRQGQLRRPPGRHRGPRSRSPPSTSPRSAPAAAASPGSTPRRRAAGRPPLGGLRCPAPPATRSAAPSPTVTDAEPRARLPRSRPPSPAGTMPSAARGALDRRWPGRSASTRPRRRTPSTRSSTRHGLGRPRRDRAAGHRPARLHPGGVRRRRSDARGPRRGALRHRHGSSSPPTAASPPRPASSPAPCPPNGCDLPPGRGGSRRRSSTSWPAPPPPTSALPRRPPA